MSLDAELLAVTEKGNRDTRKDESDGSESAGEFDGVLDSDGGDDDDRNLDEEGFDDDDDDADDAEYGIDDDDDDDDYASRRKMKKKSARPLKQKRSSSKSKSLKSRGKNSDRRTSTKVKQQESLDEDDEDQFQYDYDQHGYSNAADRDHLSKMNEFDREQIISERIDARNRSFHIWKKKREMAREAEANGDALQGRSRSSGRSKQSSKSVALQALAEDKQRKQSAKPIDIGSDADSEQDRPSEKQSVRGKREELMDSKPEAHLLKEEEGPELRYADLVTVGTDGIATTSPLILRRDTLFQLSQKPYFGRVVEGLFVRLKIGDSQDNTGSYLICRIAGLTSGKMYNLLQSGLKTNQKLLLQSGRQRRSFEMCLISSSHPTEQEFATYVERAKAGGIEIPRREEVDRLLRSSQEMIVKHKVTETEDERLQYLANMEIVYPERINWTQKRTLIETSLEVKRQELANAQDSGRKNLEQKYTGEVETMEKRLKEVRGLEAKYVLQNKKTNVEVFQNLAKRNMKLNATNESLAASRRNFESNKTAIDLFSRFDATGQSYFSIGDQDDGTAVAMSEQAKDAHTLKDWRKDLLTWEPTAKRRKIGESPLDPAYGVELPGLDDLVVDASIKIRPKKAVSLVPPGVDAVYDRPSRKLARPPSGAKLLSFDEWSKQRAA